MLWQVAQKAFCRLGERALAVIASEAKQSRIMARDKLRNLSFKEINGFEIAAPAHAGARLQKTLLAITSREFFSSLPVDIRNTPSACSLSNKKYCMSS